MNPGSRAATAVILTAAATMAAAEQRVGDTYVVPQGGYVWLDNDRNAEDDKVFGLAIGKHFSEAVSVEFGVSRGQYDMANSGELEVTTYGLDALHIFARGSVASPFVSVGGGVMDNDPRGFDSDHYWYAQTGLGLMLQVAETGDGASRFNLRPEVKARWAFPRDNDPQDKYLDYVAMLGFQFSFGDPRPAPAVVETPPPAPPAPPPPPPPPPGPKDTDGDGVFDDRDRCPDTPRGVAVDQNGCTLRGSATLQGVTFENNSATLSGSSTPVLDQVAADMKRFPRLKVLLQGHTDSVGSAAYNEQLSQRRAQSVLEYLISQGVGAQQLSARGYGEAEPVADNTSAEGRAQNRRVVMEVLENPGEVQIKVEEPAR